MMETKDVQLQGKTELISIFVAPPVAQDKRSYWLCVMSHEYAADFSSDVYCSASPQPGRRKIIFRPWKNVLDIF